MPVSRTPISSSAPWTLSDVKSRARVDGSDEDLQISIMADTAAAELERHAELALLAQSITCTMQAWGKRIALPVGPLYVAGLAAHPVTVELVDDEGNATPYPSAFWIEGQRHPVLNLSGNTCAHTLRITYPAGFGIEAQDVPADLQLAIADHAAMLYDARGMVDIPQGLSVAAARIAARYRRVAV